MSDLNALMDRDPLSLSTQDIDSIIAYQRQHRATMESGGKRARKVEGPKVDVQSVLDNLIKPKTGQGVTRRV